MLHRLRSFLEWPPPPVVPLTLHDVTPPFQPTEPRPMSLKQCPHCGSRFVTQAALDAHSTECPTARRVQVVSEVQRLQEQLAVKEAENASLMASIDLLLDALSDLKARLAKATEELREANRSEPGSAA